MLVTNPLESHCLRVVPIDMWQLRKNEGTSVKTTPVYASTNLSETSSSGCDLVGTKGPGFGVLNDQLTGKWRCAC